jgi:hypothetical protein
VINRAKAEANAFKHGLAHVMYDKLMRQVWKFEATLKKDEEIGALLSSSHED